MTITEGGTYEMQGGDYTDGVTIDTTGNVTINITGNVDYTGNVNFITISNVGALTISGAMNGKNCLITSETDKCFLTLSDTLTDMTIVTVKGGDYEWNATDCRNGDPFNVNGGTLNLENATVVTQANAVDNRGGTVHIAGGSYIGKWNTNPTLLNYKTMTVDGASITPEKGKAIRNETNATVELTNTTLSGPGTVVVYNFGTATIENCYVKDSKWGICAGRGGTGATILKSATFENNLNDIDLEKDQKITIADSFSGCATVYFDSPEENRPVTTSGSENENAATDQKKLNLISGNKGYYVAYDEAGDFRYLAKRNEGDYFISAQNATATADIGNGERDVYSFTPVHTGTTVTATPAEKPGYQFTGWTAEGIELKDKTAVPLTITMPANDVTLTANYEEATEPVPSDPVNTDPADDGSGIAGAIVTGGVLAWGAYETGTGIYRTVNMRGIPLPSDRAELALLIWEKADKPEPESAELYTDIDEDDTDLQKAARWMVEQELMKDQDDRFWPEFHVSKLRVCTTWEQAKQKGLIQ